MVRLVQCLCPQRHAIIAVAYVPGETAAQEHVSGPDDITLTEETAADYVRGIVEEMVHRGSMNPWCGICGSRDLFYEDAPTRFATMDEAQGPLREMEIDQQVSRVLMEADKERASRN